MVDKILNEFEDKINLNDLKVLKEKISKNI